MSDSPASPPSPSAGTLPRANTPPEENPRLILLEKLKKSASQGSMGKFPDPGKSEMETSKSREL